MSDFETFLGNFAPGFVEDSDFKVQSASRQDLLKRGARNYGSDNLRDNGKKEEKPFGGLMYFEGAEHEKIADGVLLWDIHGKKNKDAVKHIVWCIVRDKTYPLKFGRIIALAGDHYSTHDYETSNQRAGISGFRYYKDLSPAACKARFKSAVESLVYDLDGYFPAIAALMDKECNTMENLIEAGKKAEEEPPADGKTPITMKEAYHLHACGLPSDMEFFKALMKPSAAGKFVSLYAWLAYVNFDHFGVDAEIAYTTGHTLAIELAREAAKASTDEEKSRMLNRAYLYEAFAAHYLTDLFSTGHARAPRRKFHTPSQTDTLAANVKGQFTKKDVPIWDYHNRYMHDDDSATGLLVRNRNGEQWIAHGDKQYLEPGNILNRARVTLCLQASVDEMYDLGFRNPTAKIPDMFVASKMYPEPMLAYTDPNGWVKNWGGYDQHNPANLWQAESKDEPETKEWTYRSVPNDHSIFTRKKGSPKSVWGLTGIYATEESEKIRDSAFRGEGQFVKSESIPTLDTGGFVQIQDLRADGKRKRCINVWSPVVVNHRGDDHDCFTLRNRLIDFDAGNEFVDKDSLHWTSWNNGAGETELYHFYDNGHGVSFERHLLKDSQIQDGVQTVKFDASKSWAHTYGGRKQSHSISSEPALSGRRFLVGNFTNDSEPEPDVVMLDYSADGKARFSLARSSKGTFLVASWDKFDLKADSVHFFKQVKAANGSPQAVLTSVSKPAKQYEISLFALKFQDQSETTNPAYTATFNHDGGAENISVLSTRTPDQVLALAHAHNQFDTIAQIDIAKKSTVLHACKLQSPSYTYVGPMFSGALPSLGSDTGVDVVTVDSYKTKENGKDKYYLCFRTHIANTTASGTTDPFKGCGNARPIPDTLAEYAAIGGYHSIKWARCKLTDEDGSHCLMQIFSLFGVLGARWFTTKSTTDTPPGKAWDWNQKIGLIPYLAQTSIGAGLGSHGDWGHGFVSWGAGIEHDLVDSNVWVVGQDGNKGWGFRASDAKRKIVAGSDESVRKKQAY